jgi:hypothetical protein
MSTFQIANTSTQEANEQQSTIQRYIVRIFTDVQMTLHGNVEVLARSKDEAIDKVQVKIDAGSLDDDLHMEDIFFGISIPYEDLRCCEWYNVEIDVCGVEDDLDEISVEQVLRADVEELEAHILWDAEKLTKQKAFLKSLVEPQSAVA